MLAIVLLTSVTASVMPSFVQAKKSSDSSGSGSGSDNGDRGPAGPSKEDTKDLADDNSPNVKPGDKACDTPDCKVNQPIEPSQGNGHGDGDKGQCMIEGCGHGPVFNCRVFHIGCGNPTPVIINIHKTIHSSSNSGSSSSISKTCFDAIKIAWLGKVHRGQNHEVDQFIDNCLGVN